MGVHVWRFTPVQDGVRVQTEASWDGGRVRRDRDRMQQALDQSIRSWLENLKRAPESQRRMCPQSAEGSADCG